MANEYNKKPHGKKRIPNYPRIIGLSTVLLLILAIIISIVVIIIRLNVWNKGVDYNMTAEDYDKIKLDTKDNVVLIPPSILAKDTYDGTTSILIFGNDSYYEGCKDGSGIIDSFAKEVPNAEIYNCCLPGSYLCSFNAEEKSPAECPEDYFTLFWLSVNLRWANFDKQYEALSYLDPEKYDVARYEEVIKTLETVDLSKIDVIMFCYDGHDYLRGNLPINYIGENAQTENITSVLGASYTSIYLFNYMNPAIQYVFVSPGFCYAKDENGNNISCAMRDTGNGTIAETFNAARHITDYYGISYVDMFSGVLINEDNAFQYLEDDGITPNKKARRLMADRLVTLLKERL